MKILDAHNKEEQSCYLIWRWFGFVIWDWK